MNGNNAWLVDPRIGDAELSTNKDECGITGGIAADFFYRAQYGAQPKVEPVLHGPQNRRSDEHSPDTVINHSQAKEGCVGQILWNVVRGEFTDETLRSTSVEAPTVWRNDGILQYCGTSSSL